MAFRKSTKIFSKVINFLQFSRGLASESKLVGVTLNEKTGVATVTLQRPPVNSLNYELLSEFSNLLGELEKNKARGMILTSSSNTVFSGGLDIMEMYKPNEDRIRKFWSALQDAWIGLYGAKFPTVACINGHAPAGGCLLSMSCEYRVMLPKYTIGLNETQLGMLCPPWFVTTMVNTIGRRQTEYAIARGRLFSTEEALQVQLIDEVANSKEEALEKCEKFLGGFTRLPPIARALNKNAIRNESIKALQNNKEADLQESVKYLTQEHVQKAIGFYLESLKKKAAAS